MESGPHTLAVEADLSALEHSDLGQRSSLGFEPPASTLEGGGQPRVLAVGTDEWAVRQMATGLERQGCAVLRCHDPGAPVFPCNALRPDRVCPIDAGFDVVVTMRARGLASITPGEWGVVCALHAGKPLVVAGVGTGSPLQQWTTALVPQGGDVMTAVKVAVRKGS